MKQALLRPFAALVITAMCGALAFGQTTGGLSGTVTDQAGAVVSGATIVVKNNDTGAEQTVQSSDGGTFNVPALPAGTYTVTITATSFKKSIVQDVKVNVGTPSSIAVALEVGSVGETVTITGAGGELLQTQSATVGTTITGRQITDLPFASRDALDLVLLLPGTQTPGRPRTSSVNGLPKGGLNITLDGVNVQDNLLKSSDGFFTYIRPRIDAIDEVTVSTATPGAESSGEGAVQIKFVTRAGTNDLNGSLYWYHRNPSLNANYWFNNRDLPPDADTGKAPRTRILLNQYGARVGGPIRIPGLFDGRDKMFFFVNYEEFRLPEQTPIRNRTILTPLAQTGVYTYVTNRTATIPTGCEATSATQMTCTRNLLALAGAFDCNTATAGVQACLPGDVDPTVGALLAQIRSSTSGGGISPITNDPNRQRFSFINPGGQVRYFPTVRLDWNITKDHHIENIWNYQAFRNTVDFLNNIDPAFPGFPNFGGQNSNRFSNTTALRSTFTNQLVNEARFGLTGGTSLFSDGVNAGQFQNQGGFSVALGSGLTSPTVRNSTERRNSPVKNFTNTMTYVTGSHTINFGGGFDQINFWRVTEGVVVPTITLGFDATRDANLTNAFTTAGLPGATAAQLNEARALYATLSGRVTGVGRTAFLDENTEQYQVNGPLTTRYRQRQYGLFVQDSWRYRPNLTLNYGLRYEPQYPFVPLNNVYTFVPFEQLFGVSGEGNLFRPGTQTGQPSTFNRISAGEQPFAPDKNNFAPSIGFAYSPDWRSGVLNRLFGDGGQTVLRGGYSIAYIREAGSIVLSILGANRGASVTASRSTADAVATGLNLPVGTLFRNRADLFAPNIPATQTFPDPGLVTEAVNGFEPDLKTGYAQSWSFGIQRELTKDTVFEARYVGTRGVKLWQQMNLNEVNVVENGFINEFRIAQQNLAANLAAPTSFFSATDPRRQSIAFTGAPGTAPIPIIFMNLVANQRVAANTACPTVTPTNPACYNTVNNAGAFTGVGLFSNATVLSAFNVFSPSAIGLAGILSNAGNNSIFRPNRDSFGLPANFFRLNPDKLGGAFVVTNNGRSWYDAMTLELRRRMSKGLLLQGSYTWSKSLTNMYASNSDLFAQPITLRDRTLDKVESPFDIRHAFKVNWIYELPVGRGQRFLGDSNGFVNQLMGGWEVHGTARVQSGSPISLGNVQLVNMTKEDLQNAIDVRRGTNVLTWLPDDIIANTQAAFNTTLTGYSAQFGAPDPNGRYIAPANSNGCIQRFGGDCGISNLVLWGPKFARVDMSVVKKFKFTETKNIEFRTELLNAFNNINFLIGAPANDVNSLAVGGATFGQVTNAYNDLSTTNDPGGRLIQFVLRLNF